MAELLNIAAAPLSLLYKSAAWLQRRRRARRAAAPPGVFVISVDAIAFGGSGKTPMVIRVGEELRDMGRPFAVITRGYRSRLEKSGGRLDPQRHGPADAGDEACLIQRRLPGVPVWVGRDRWASLAGAAREGARVVILDDGFQSTHIRRHLTIMLDNPDHPWSRLRHFPCLMAEADLRLALAGSRRPPRVPVHGTFRMPLQGLFDHRDRRREIGAAPVLGFSALGDNARFRRDLSPYNLRGFRSFRDHHAFRPRDLRELNARRRSLGARFMVCTEKDFVKILPLAPPGTPLLYAANGVQLDMNLGDYLRQHVPE